MLALLYVAIAVAFGDSLARRFFTYSSWLHRIATAFLVGLLVSSWVSYLAALAFHTATQPLGPGDLASGSALAIAAVWLRQRGVAEPLDRPTPRGPRWDWIVMAAIGLLVTWMMTSTFSFVDGQLRIASGLWSDFGPTTALAQSFVFGHNFPTEYPHFAGETIRYHFLFYFQVGNLTYLGLDPAIANNLLSSLSIVSMLALVMALGRRLFKSELVGRLGALLFFFHGALSFVPYLATFHSVPDAIAAIPHLDHFLSSGFAFRGEDWGIWTQIVFLNQRHLASAIGVFLIALMFVLDRVDVVSTPAAGLEGTAGPIHRARAAAREGVSGVRHAFRDPIEHVRAGLRDSALPGYLFCGFLLGLLPLWNGAIFITAAVALAILFVLFPNRVQMAALAIAAVVPAIPQLVFLHPVAVSGGPIYPTLHWGYVVDDPTLAYVGGYLAFIFGPKLILCAMALLVGTSVQRRLFLAATGLVALAFSVQVSTEVLANHKFINTWLVITNLFVAYALVRLWRTRPSVRLPARVAAVSLATVILAGGVIDLFPVANQQIIGVTLTGDPLYEWVQADTKPDDIFLSDLYVVHPILLAGRRLFYGWPYYAWSAGYDTLTRERLYREMFESRSPRHVAELLIANHIVYVAIDDGLRQRGFVQHLNAEVFSSYFEPAFVDTADQHGNLVIYKVPTDASGLPDSMPGDMYTGGHGNRPAQFDKPVGAIVERSGTLLVADTGNDRIQRLSPSGTALGSFGSPGRGPGEFDHPTGVAVDSRGDLYIADTGNRRIQEFDPHGGFMREIAGRAYGFVAPGDVAIASDDSLFVLDRDAARIVRINPDGSLTSWGGVGSGSGQMDRPTGLSIQAGTVAVADTGNRRIEIFTLSGHLITSWAVAEWATTTGAPPDVLVTNDGKVYASSPDTNQIVVYRSDGTRLGTLTPSGSDALSGPAGLAIKPGGAIFVVDSVGNRVTLLTQTNP